MSFDLATIKAHRIKEDEDYEGMCVIFLGYLERAQISHLDRYRIWRHHPCPNAYSRGRQDSTIRPPLVPQCMRPRFVRGKLPNMSANWVYCEYERASFTILGNRPLTPLGLTITIACHRYLSYNALTPIAPLAFI
jgi:hypothetical protein